MSDINPTIGRVVHFNPTMSHADKLGMVYRCQGTPMDAHIVYVWPSGLVNLAVFDHDGIQHAVTSVKLLQDVSQAPLNAQGQLVESYCTWMPYQKGQAAKTEQAEKAAQALGERAGCGKCIGQCQGHQTLAGADEAHMVKLLLEKGSVVKVNGIPLLLDRDVVVRTHLKNVPLAFPEAAGLQIRSE